MSCRVGTVFLLHCLAGTVAGGQINPRTPLRRRRSPSLRPRRRRPPASATCRRGKLFGETVTAVGSEPNSAKKS